MKTCLKLFFFILFFLRVESVIAYERLLLFEPDGDQYTSLINNVVTQLAEAKIIIERIPESDWLKVNNTADSLIITFGTRALTAALAEPNQSTIYANGVLWQNAQVLRQDNTYARTLLAAEKLFFFYSELPLDRYIEVANRYLDVSSVTLVVDENAASYHRNYHAKHRDTQASILGVNVERFSANTLKADLENTQLVVLYPGRYVSTFFLRWLLHTAYELALPVFAYNDAFLSLGAALSLEIEWKSYARDVVTNIKSLLEVNKTEKAYPSTFLLKKNNSVFRVLGIDHDREQGRGSR